MRSLFDIAAVVLCVIALGLIGFGTASKSGSRPGLEVDAASKSFGEVTSGDFIYVPFRFTNRTGTPLHIVGATRICARGGCLNALKLPATIPAYGSVDVNLGINSAGVTPYRSEINLYTDCPERPVIPLEVTGLITRDSGAKPPG